MSVQFVDIEPEVIKELCDGRRAREVLELTKLRNEVGQWSNAPELPQRSVNGLGRMQLSIPPLAYHYWGQRLGYDCWKDANFRREYARDNPGVRVQQGVTPTITAGWEGSKRFKKSYAHC